MKFVTLIFLIASVTTFAAPKDSDRKPSSVIKKAGVVCAQDTTLNGAVGGMNDSIGNAGKSNTYILIGNNETATVQGATVSNITVNTIPNKNNGSGYDFIVCGVVSN